MVSKRTKKYRLNGRKFAAFIGKTLLITFIAYMAICYLEVVALNTQGANYSEWNFFTWR